jgi:hypothetical protein
VDIVADGTFIQYNIYKKLVFDYADNTPLLQDTEQIKNYKNAFSGKVGVNYKSKRKVGCTSRDGVCKKHRLTKIMFMQRLRTTTVSWVRWDCLTQSTTNLAFTQLMFYKN